MCGLPITPFSQIINHFNILNQPKNLNWERILHIHDLIQLCHGFKIFTFLWTNITQFHPEIKNDFLFLSKFLLWREFCYCPFYRHAKLSTFSEKCFFVFGWKAASKVKQSIPSIRTTWLFWEPTSSQNFVLARKQIKNPTSTISTILFNSRKIC